jgi:transposase
LVDQNEEYVRRRRWSRDEKRAIVKEAATSGNVIGTAKRHGIQAQQIYRWRDRLFGPAEPAGFVAVSFVADPPTALPAPVPELDCPLEHPAPVLDGVNDRIEIASGSGVTVRLPSGSSAALIVAIATGMARRR